MIIHRNKEHKHWPHYDDLANEIFQDSYNGDFVDKLFKDIMPKNVTRVEYAKFIARDKAKLVMHNLCQSNWIVLSNVQKKRDTVRKFWWGVIHSIDAIESVTK